MPNQPLPNFQNAVLVEMATDGHCITMNVWFDFNKGTCVRKSPFLENGMSAVFTSCQLSRTRHWSKTDWWPSYAAPTVVLMTEPLKQALQLNSVAMSLCSDHFFIGFGDAYSSAVSKFMFKWWTWWFVTPDDQFPLVVLHICLLTVHSKNRFSRFLNYRWTGNCPIDLVFVFH